MSYFESETFVIAHITGVRRQKGAWGGRISVWVVGRKRNRVAKAAVVNCLPVCVFWSLPRQTALSRQLTGFGLCELFHHLGVLDHAVGAQERFFTNSAFLAGSSILS